MTQPLGRRRPLRALIPAALLAVLVAPTLAATGAQAASSPADRADRGDRVVPATSTTSTPKRFTNFRSAAKATITPGVMMYTAGAQCTANFVYTDKVGRVYVGYAAHCAGQGEATDTNGCLNESVPLGTKVTFVEGGSLASGGTKLGTGKLAYSSWITMNRLGTPTSSNTCAYNDIALVKVDTKDKKKVNPSVPFFGGPTGIDTDGTAAGDTVYSYGNSSIRGGLTALSPKVGVSLGDMAADGGWSHPVYTLTPGIPGDSGSGFLTAGGKAVGTLSTLGLAPLPLSNNLGDLAKELAFARQHSGLPGLQLTEGTVKFRALPVG